MDSLGAAYLHRGQGKGSLAWLLREELSHTLLAPEQPGGPLYPWLARAWGRLAQGPSTSVLGLEAWTGLHCPAGALLTLQLGS